MSKTIPVTRSTVESARLLVETADMWGSGTRKTAQRNNFDRLSVRHSAVHP